MTNHVEGHTEVSRKHDLFRNLRHYFSEISTSAQDESVFHITPLTFYVKVQPEKGVYQSIK